VQTPNAKPKVAGAKINPVLPRSPATLHVIVLLYPHGAQEALRGLCCCRELSALLGQATVGCRAVGQLSAVNTLGPDSDEAPRLSDSAVRLSQITDRRAVRLPSEKVLSALSGGCRALPGAVRGLLSGCQTRAQYVLFISLRSARGSDTPPQISIQTPSQRAPKCSMEPSQREVTQTAAA